MSRQTRERDPARKQEQQRDTVGAKHKASITFRHARPFASLCITSEDLDVEKGLDIKLVVIRKIRPPSIKTPDRLSTDP